MSSEDKRLDLLKALKDVVEAQAWHHIGEASFLKGSSCRKLYGEIEADDVVLVYDEHNDSFHAMDAVCSHEGGPLEMGDIEEIGANRCIVCPWHNYEFKLSDGYSESSGLQQEVYPVMVLDGHVYLRTGENEVSLQERSKQPQTSTENPEKTHNPEPADENSLTWAAYQILTAETPEQKVELSNKFGNQWLQREIATVGNIKPPDEPSRHNLNVVAPGKEAKRGKGGNLANRISILHSLANIELWAVDLSWDIIARFPPHNSLLNTEFIDDFIQIALEETKHFHLLNTRMKSLGSYFGALSVHNALWESAAQTENDLLGRLAVVHMVHEARGLDVQPAQIDKFTRQKDWDSVKILSIVYEEEIGHVSLGLKWFHRICQLNSKNPVEEFHKTVKQNYRGYLKPPFNTEARKKAGMTPEWYEPLTKSYSLKQQQHIQTNSARMYSTTTYRTTGYYVNQIPGTLTPYMSWLKNIRHIRKLTVIL